MKQVIYIWDEQNYGNAELSKSLNKHLYQCASVRVDDGGWCSDPSSAFVSSVRDPWSLQESKPWMHPLHLALTFFVWSLNKVRQQTE